MVDPALRPYVLLPGVGRSIDLGNFAMSVKADGLATDAVFSLLEATEPAGFGPPMHVHTNAAEAFYVLEGEYRIVIEDQEHACPAGSFMEVLGPVPEGYL